MSEPAVRVSTEEEALRAGIRALVRRFSISERADVTCCGMTVAQAAILEILALEGARRPGQLARRLGISPSTLTRNVARLERQGLVERRPDPADARSAELVLGAEGRLAADRVESLERELARSILTRLPSERRRQTIDALADLVRAVAAATESCCPGAFEHLNAVALKRRADEEIP